VTETCVSLFCKAIRLFDIVTGSGFVDYSQTLIRIGSVHGNLNVKDLLPHPTTIPCNTQKEARKFHKSLIPSIQSLNDLRQCCASTDMWIDAYKHISYKTLTLHFTEENWKLWNKVLFTCEFPDDRKTESNIRMGLSCRLEN
jgi:hypothetical protein